MIFMDDIKKKKQKEQGESLAHKLYHLTMFFELICHLSWAACAGLSYMLYCMLFYIPCHASHV